MSKPTSEPSMSEEERSLRTRIGANLLDSMFAGVYRGKTAHPPDVGDVLARAADAGVERIIVT